MLLKSLICYHLKKFYISLTWDQFGIMKNYSKYENVLIEGTQKKILRSITDLALSEQIIIKILSDGLLQYGRTEWTIHS